MKHNLTDLISRMTLEEKAGMCSGLDFWHLKGVERLDIPSVMVSDGPHGLRKQDAAADHLGINDSIKAVCFPPACLTACSFDRALLREMGETIGREAQANDVSVILGPGMNIKRSPLCGRNFEYYSEDPYLTGQMAAAFVQGVESQGVGTSLKHFAANSQEHKRMSSSSDVDERTLQEIYLPAFETAVKEGGPTTVMCSYNRLNGIYASEHPWLLTDVLRDEWGFEGYVVSDWGAVNDRVAGLKAGMDLEMPASGGISDAQIVAAVKDGSLDEAVLDRAVERILRAVLAWSDHHRPQPFTMDADHEAARKIAGESMVLLKNEGVLPLNRDEKLAFIGGFAEEPRYQGGGSSHINAFRTSSVLEAAADHTNITYAKGFSSTGDIYDETLAAQAIAAAKAADKAVIFAGLPESFESEGYDRSHMGLPVCQDRLIAEIAAVQPNTVVVLHNGAPVELPWLHQVKGILEAYLGGQAAGQAVADILFGDVNPSGKLAETFPVKLADNPAHLNFGDDEHVNYAEGIFVGYRYYDAKEMAVAFPFGHGLSYTTFAYSDLRLSADTFVPGGKLTVTVDVTNTGSRFGKETVQLYVADRTGAIRRPLQELKGFEKIALAPGETKTVTMELNDRSFAFYHTGLHDWYVPSGQFELLVGASSRDIRLSASVTAENPRQLPLNLHMNTTIGELKADARTRQFGIQINRMLDHFFGINESEAVSDDMGDAMADSMPLRNVLSFGIMTREEMERKLDELMAL